MIAALRCAVHRSNLPSSGSGFAGAFCGFIRHLHFDYWVSSSRGGHFISALPNGKWHERSKGYRAPHMLLAFMLGRPCNSGVRPSLYRASQGRCAGEPIWIETF